MFEPFKFDFSVMLMADVLVLVSTSPDSYQAKLAVVDKVVVGGITHLPASDFPMVMEEFSSALTKWMNSLSNEYEESDDQGV